MTEAEILIVDDDPASITALKHALTGQARLRFATHGSEALRMVQRHVPDMVLLDIGMPGLSGYEVCRALQDDPLTADVPVIFLTSHDNAEEELTGLSLGAVDFIAKQVRPPLVCARVRTHLRLKRMADALRRAASEDALTGLANRRRFDEALVTEWLRHLRSRRPLSLLMIDIDHFKAYNDHHGHPAGDQCLRLTARALQDVSLRPADLLARLGGKEFGLLLPDTDAVGAQEVARRLLTAADTLALPHGACPDRACVSWSIGVACSTQLRQDLQANPSGSRALMEAADQALYEAKRSGRARFALAHP